MFFFVYNNDTGSVSPYSLAKEDLFGHFREVPRAAKI